MRLYLATHTHLAILLYFYIKKIEKHLIYSIILEVFVFEKKTLIVTCIFYSEKYIYTQKIKQLKEQSRLKQLDKYK